MTNAYLKVRSLTCSCRQHDAGLVGHNQIFFRMIYPEANVLTGPKLRTHHWYLIRGIQRQGHGAEWPKQEQRLTWRSLLEAITCQSHCKVFPFVPKAWSWLVATSRRQRPGCMDKRSGPDGDAIIGACQHPLPVSRAGQEGFR